MEIKPVPETYQEKTDHGGRTEELPIAGFSPAIVYLPYGYDDSVSRYSTFYLLHGGGGDPHSFFDEDGTFKNMLDHMITHGDIDPLIVIAPTFYRPEQNGNGADYSDEAVRDFGPVLCKQIVPLVDHTYRTIADRQNRAIGGFSMGAVATWYALMAGLDSFHWFMPLSGDCWICEVCGGGKHPEQTALMLSNTVSGRSFYLHALTGDRDIAYPNLDAQIQAMKEYDYAFEFGVKTHYSVMEDGVHDYPDIRRYIFNALPEFFKSEMRNRSVRSVIEYSEPKGRKGKNHEQNRAG